VLRGALRSGVIASRIHEKTAGSEAAPRAKRRARRKAATKPLLGLTFGAVPPVVFGANRRGAVDQLGRWIERVLSANSAAEVVVGD
jgi:hypothetical protein